MYVILPPKLYTSGSSWLLGSVIHYLLIHAGSMLVQLCLTLSKSNNKQNAVDQTVTGPVSFPLSVPISYLHSYSHCRNYWLLTFLMSPLLVLDDTD